MAENDLAEKDYRIALRAAMAINAVGEALDVMSGLARHWLEHGQEQEGANLLVFVMNHPDVRYDTFDQAEDLFFDLESRICPRVIADAKQFILGKTLATVAAHILSSDSEGKQS
jgi:hypothetical protein